MRRSALQVALLAIALGCAGSGGEQAAAPSPKPAGASEASELVVSLLVLADTALDRGDVAAAEQRYRRALRLAPSIAAPRIGLARVAQRRGDIEQARRWLEQATSLPGATADAHLALADLEEASGDRASALAQVERALGVQPDAPAAHEALARLTGPAPRRPAPADVASARELALRHPFDLWAALQWARLARDVDPDAFEAALDVLDDRLWLADLDARSFLEAVDLLRGARPDWANRRVVAVHLYADETVRAHAGWAMRLRWLLRGQNEGLSRLLDTVFVPAGIGAFSSGRATDALASIDRVWRDGTRSWPSTGVIAAFTERPAPRRTGRFKLGQAVLLGRRMLVRLEPGENDSWTLAHEILHLYGGVHIRGEIDSLMNPSGDSDALDPANQRIVTLTRGRRFAAGGLGRNVFPFVDLEALTLAYREMLRINLAFRRVGLDRALEASKTSRYHAADLAREEASEDDHFGDVARFVASLLLAQDRLAEAALFLDGASRLYGPNTTLGSEARRNSDEIYRLLEARGEL